MSNKPSNPISVNQIVDTNLKLKCITEPDCRTFPNDVQALIDDYCKSKFDDSKIVKGCLTTLPCDFDINVLLNKIIVHLCGITTGTGGNNTTIDFNTINLSGINFCPNGDWLITDPLCLKISDSCSNPITTYNIYDVLRAIINRIISLEIIVKTLNQKIDNQQVTINTHTSEINLIKQNCCNVTLISEIQTIKNRLQAAGIP